MLTTFWAAFLVASAAASAVDINVAPDEAKKAEQVVLTPLVGEGYYDAAALAELALVRAHRSPTGALWRSFAVPGWGQYYNQKYYKVPAIAAAEGATLYMAIQNYFTARRYLKDAYRQTDPKEKRVLLDKHNDYIVETEFWGWVFVGSLAYSMMDAYVDAHLADWDVKDLPADKGASPVGVEVGPGGVSLAVRIF